ncbi:MAG: prepilin-type N-terminal cleavage/methylation domain-containing protein [Rhodospirillaceae bacterium]
MAQRANIQAGFTLIELMVVVTIVGIIAGFGIRYFTNYAYTSQVKQVLPLLTSISEKERIYFNRNGKWLASINEQVLHDSLGVSLSRSGNFCFVVSCQTAATCQGGAAVGPLYVATGNAPSFQVRAYLRDFRIENGVQVVNDNPALCVVSPGKSAPDGWGVAERYVVLSYPFPVDGTVVDGSNVSWLWRNGMSFTNARAD